MFQTRTFRDKIEFEPRALSSEWKDNLLQSLKRLKEKSISPSQGVILSVVKINHVDPPKVNNGKIIGLVEYEAISFFPSIGEVYEGVISMVLPLGLVIEADMIRILIQPNNLPSGYKFDASRKVFTNGIHSYGLNLSVFFKILNIQYKPDKLNCIGAIFKREDQEQKIDQRNLSSIVIPSIKEGKYLDKEEIFEEVLEKEILEPIDTFED